MNKRHLDYPRRTVYARFIFLIITFFVPLLSSFSLAKIPDGVTCYTCHTMHYSQNLTLPAGAGTGGPFDFLLLNNCIGCHSNDTSNTKVSYATNGYTPIVFNDTTVPAIPLAGGNFYWIVYGNDNNGHNVVDLGDAFKEGNVNMFRPPGMPDIHGGGPSSDTLTCAGNNGCHGKRKYEAAATSNIYYLKGAHHNNVDGQLNKPLTSMEVYESYRFLWGVQGYEDSDWQYTKSVADHNEYYGQNSPMSISGCDSTKCHGTISVQPSNQTMSGFCGTCHGDFHSLEGMGGTTSSPFSRHPSDVILPNSGEYSAYQTYNLDIPVARAVVPNGSSSTVDTSQPGTEFGGIVMCLSCHYSHASPYYKMLRWDYKSGTLSTALSGCNVCHTSKN